MTLVDVPERTIRLLTVVLVLSFGAIGVVAAMSQDGPNSPTRLVVVGLIYLTTIPVSAFFVRGRLGLLWRRQLSVRGQVLTSAFVVYADVGVVAVLAALVDHEFAMYGTALFAVIAVFAGHFAPRPIVIAHVVYATVTITVLAWLTWQQGQHDLAGVVARWLVSVVSVNCALVLQNGFARGVQKALDTQLDNATRDPLTGLLNRRGLELWADQLLRARSDAVGFIVLDLDNFKVVNDTHGHEAGDSALVLVGERLGKMLGPDATIARIGGEEFALVLAADCEETLEIANALLGALHHRDDAVPVSVSIGVSALASEEGVRNDPVAALSEGLRRADAALFGAKHAGRNQVRAYQATRDHVSPPGTR